MSRWTFRPLDARKASYSSEKALTRSVAACRLRTFLDLMCAETSEVSWRSQAASQAGAPSAAHMRRAMMSKRLLSLWKMASVWPGLNMRSAGSAVGMAFTFGSVIAYLRIHSNIIQALRNLAKLKDTELHSLWLWRDDPEGELYSSVSVLTFILSQGVHRCTSSNLSLGLMQLLCLEFSFNRRCSRSV